MLEKILNELEKRRRKVKNAKDLEWNQAIEMCGMVIRKHMNDDWIPVKMKFPPQYKELWVTVERDGETFVATDSVTESGDFQYYDNILAWKEKESMPEPYHPEKGAEE